MFNLILSILLLQQISFAQEVKPLELEECRIYEPIIYVGASQLSAGIGKALQEQMGYGVVMAKTGSTPGYWAEDGWSLLKRNISSRTKTIVIVTGGNGSYGADKLLYKIYTTLVEQNTLGKVTVIWIGANPPGANSFKNGLPFNSSSYFKYLNTVDGFMEATARRAHYNNDIKLSIQKYNWIFIDPYDFMMIGKNLPGFICQNCDGIHMPYYIAKKLIIDIFNSGLFDE